MIDRLYETLAFPEACRLGNRVPKKQFYENATLGPADVKAFRDDVDVIHWVYTLKPNNTSIKPWVDCESEYEEIVVLQVDAKTQQRTGRLAQVIHRAIPYPLIVIFAFESSVAFSLAPKRFSQAEKGAIVAEEFYSTGWINTESATAVEQVFLASIQFDKLPKSHFLAFYSSFVDRVIALDCARLSGEFRIENTAELQKRRRENLAHCHELEVQIAELRAAIKKETRFNRQVQLNIRIKLLTEQLKADAIGL